MTITFGVSPIAWINDDMPDLGGDTPVETIFRDAQELGFDGVELGGKFPRDPAVLKKELVRFDLQLIWRAGDSRIYSNIRQRMRSARCKRICCCCAPWAAPSLSRRNAAVAFMGSAESLSNRHRD